METGRYVFGDNVETREETPTERRSREYHAEKTEIEKRHKTALMALARKQLLERNELDAVYNQAHTENAVRAGLRKEGQP